MSNKNNTVLTSVAAIYRDFQGKRSWLIVKKNEDADWEFPKITVRKTESSARGAIRMAGEMLGATCQILEEVGRSGGVVNVNGKALSQRQLYYLMKLKAQAGEPIGFADQVYLDYSQAYRKLGSKRDKQMLSAARELLKKLQNKKTE